MIDFFLNLTFASPWWFLALPLLTPLFFLKGKSGSPASITYSSLSILVSLGQKPRSAAGAFTFALMVLALISAITALARPQKQDEFSNRKASGIDIILAVDISYSMEILDFELNQRRVQRIVAAKATAEQFIKQRPNDRIGLVAFSGRPYVTSPITLEHDWLIEQLRELKPGLVKEQGTAIGSAIAASATRLHDRKAKSKVVILITDGSNNSGRLSPAAAAELANQLKVKIYSVAIGTEDGRLQSGRQSHPQKEFDTKTLEDIARATGGEYYRVRNTERLRETFTSIDQLEKTDVKQHNVIITTEYFHWCIGAALLLAFTAITIQSISPQAAP